MQRAKRLTRSIVKRKGFMTKKKTPPHFLVGGFFVGKNEFLNFGLGVP